MTVTPRLIAIIYAHVRPALPDHRPPYRNLHSDTAGPIPAQSQAVGARRRLGPWRRCILLGSACFAAIGCTADFYRRDADLQVQRLIADRQRQTLAYEFDAMPRDEQPVDTGQSPLRRIPVTPIPVATGSVLERAEVTVPFGPLGPENMLPPGVEPPPMSDYRSSVRDQPLVEAPVLGPPSPSDRQLVQLDLFGVLRFAAEHSREYQTRLEELYLAALDVTLQRHLLSPRPFVTQRLAYEGGQQSVNYRSALAATTTAGVRQRLPYGGEIVASSLVTFVDALNTATQGSESAQLALTATVPLLRGAGFVNLEALIASERNLVYAVRSFETYRRQFLVDVASRYIDLLATRNAVLNRRAQLDSQIDLVERSRALFAAGKGSFLDVQRSLNSQISGETSLIQAEEQYRAQLDNFKVFIGMDVTQELEILPSELDVSVPGASADDAVKLAQHYRLDVVTARDRIDDARRAVANARNSLLPSLDLEGGARVGNNRGDPASALNSETATYNAGVLLDLPVDRVAERNAYRRALIRLQQAQRDYEQSRQAAAAAARNALRRIASARDRVELQRQNVQIAQARLDLANSLLRQPLLSPLPGLSQSNRDVVEAQQQLLQAQDALDAARAALQVQVLNYYRDTGTLRIDPESGMLGRALLRGESR
ncbi:MAG: TolC family protein [Tepidisphaerales bacterium]